jgi:hypothetical protein
MMIHNIYFRYPIPPLPATNQIEYVRESVYSDLKKWISETTDSLERSQHPSGVSIYYAYNVLSPQLKLSAENNISPRDVQKKTLAYIMPADPVSRFCLRSINR